MNGEVEPERVATAVIGGGQAGLAVGYHLSRRDLPHVILDANPRIGDAWRNRWDSLHVFTPRPLQRAAGDAIPGSGPLIPHEGRGGGLPRGLRGAVRAAGSNRRLPRVVGVRRGLPVLEDGRVLEVANIISGTGFHHDFPWIDLPVFGDEGPTHDRGVVAGEPGLYFVGLFFLYAGSSGLLRGVGRDAERIVKAIGSGTM